MESITSFVTSSIRDSPAALLLCSALLLVAAYYGYPAVTWYRKFRAMAREVDKLPGDKPHWFLGNFYKHPGPTDAGLEFMLDMGVRNGGKVMRMWQGPVRAAVVLHHPDTVKLALKASDIPKALQGHGAAYSLIRPWLGDGLLIANGAKWQRNRKLLTPAFHFEILKPYMQVNNEAVDIMLGKWEKAIEAKPQESIEIHKPISLCTLDIIMKCALSYDVNIQASDDENLYVKHIFSLSEFVGERYFNFLMHFDWLFYKTRTGRKFTAACDYVHKIAEEIIARRKLTLQEQGDEGKGRRRDFLDIILLARDENGLGLTDLEIRNEVDTFLFEGHDTTASGLSWFLYNLASHPDIQERVYEEVNALVAGRDSPYISWADVAGGSELQYLTMCIKESMRLHPPVPFIVRDLVSPLEIEGVTLQPGTVLDVAIWLLHHNPLVWGDDHMEYKPERFSPENVKVMETYAFLPFSAGSRNCIGQVFALHEFKSIAARIINRFKLEVDMTHKVETLPSMVLRPKNGIKLKMTLRS